MVFDQVLKCIVVHVVSEEGEQRRHECENGG